MKITENSIIGEVLDLDNGCAPFFLEMGMHCLGCPHARSESIGDACKAHGADAQALLAKLNEYFENK